MCQTCGCAHTEPAIATSAQPAQVVEVGAALLAANDARAAQNRAMLDAHGILAVNLMSSPGAGKTALLEATLAAGTAGLRAAVVEGDLATENDAQRIRACGIPAVQITTGSACHLDAQMLAGALAELDLHALDIVFIENVGNLVCPASFDLGQHRNVVLLSVPEGDDKPAKYPVMFRAADLVLLTKADLLPHLPEFSVERARRCLEGLAVDTPLHEVSVRSGAGVHDWLDWLSAARAASYERQATARAAHGAHSHHHAPRS